MLRRTSSLTRRFFRGRRQQAGAAGLAGQKTVGGGSARAQTHASLPPTVGGPGGGGDLASGVRGFSDALQGDLFKKVSGAYVTDIVEYVRSWLNTNPNGEVHVGADSKSIEGQVIVFAVAVVLYQKRLGGHVIYKTVKVPYIGPRKNLVHCRLLEECSQALTVADQLANGEKDKQNITVHIDCSPDQKYLSHSIHNSGLGWIKSAGFKAMAKPNAWAASSVANYIVNGQFGVPAAPKIEKMRRGAKGSQVPRKPRKQRGQVNK